MSALLTLAGIALIVVGILGSGGLLAVLAGAVLLMAGLAL